MHVKITDRTKRILKASAVVVAAAWIAWITASVHGGSDQARGLSSLGGGPIVGGGGGIGKVTITGPLLTGSGTSGNPLGATVTAGSGLGSGGAEILYVNAGSGITADGTNTRLNEGSGLTWCSGAACTNAGSGLTYSSGALITNAGSGLTYSSGALITNVGTGLSYSAGAVIVSIAGGTCSNGTVATAVSSSGAVTCGNADPNNYAGTHRQWREEFTQGGSMATTTFLAWTELTMAGSAESGASTGGVAGRVGVMQFTTGTGTATGRNSVFTTPTLIDFNSDTLTEGRVVLDAETLSSASSTTYTLMAGFGDSATAVDQIDGCYFLYDKANTATSGPNSGNADKWECWCSSNSARTTYLMDGSTTSDESFTTVNQPVAAGSMPSTNVYNLDVKVTGTTRAEFYVNGVKSCDINTHIPSGSSRMTGFVYEDKVNAGSANYTFDLDYMGLDIDLSSAPTP